jgi:hypothetical protein
MILPTDNLPVRRCPSCDGPMNLVRTFPKLGGLPELLVFQCSPCEEVETIEGPVI